MLLQTGSLLSRGSLLKGQETVEYGVHSTCVAGGGGRDGMLGGHLDIETIGHGLRNLYLDLNKDLLHGEETELKQMF